MTSVIYLPPPWRLCHVINKSRPPLDVESVEPCIAGGRWAGHGDGNVSHFATFAARCKKDAAAVMIRRAGWVAGTTQNEANRRESYREKRSEFINGAGT